MFKGNRSSSGGYIDWGKVDQAPIEVIEAIKGDLPNMIAQMNVSDKMELLGNYHNRTTDKEVQLQDIKARLAQFEANRPSNEAQGPSVGDIVTKLDGLAQVLDVVVKKNPKWFK
jgi:hypothetical protein